MLTCPEWPQDCFSSRCLILQTEGTGAHLSAGLMQTSALVLPWFLIQCQRKGNLAQSPIATKMLHHSNTLGNSLP